MDLQPPFPIEDVPDDYLRSAGQVISVLGALWFFYKAVRVVSFLVLRLVNDTEVTCPLNPQVVIFRRNPPKFNSLYMDGFYDILL